MARVVRVRRRVRRPQGTPVAPQPGIRRPAVSTPPADITVVLAASTSQRTLIASKLAGRPGIKVSAMAGDERSTVEAVAKSAPDAAIIDMDLGAPLAGLAVCRQIQRIAPTTAIILCVGDLDPMALRPYSRDFGTSWSYVHRKRATDGEHMRNVIQSVSRGIQWLDPEIGKIVQVFWKTAAQLRELEAQVMKEEAVPEGGIQSTTAGSGYQGRARSLDVRRNQRFDF